MHDPDYGTYSADPRDPRTPEAMQFTSMQPLGTDGCQVLVAYDMEANGSIEIVGVTVSGYEVDPSYFDAETVEEWADAIRAELRAEAATAAADADDALLLDAEVFA